MTFRLLKFFLIVFIPAIFLSGSQPVRPHAGYWAMKGTIVTHFFENDTDSLSGQEIFELRDENEMPLWFSRHIFKDVCISGKCKMISLWLFWDGAGNYLGMEIPDDAPLTKSDHTKFEPADYVKLESILKDTASILKDLKQEDLIIIPDSLNLYKAYEVDGYTAATKPALAEVVVKDAVFTCHTLWHTVYGPVQDTIQGILENRINEEFLSRMLSGSNPVLAIWAIEHTGNYHHELYTKVLESILSDHSGLANRALDYFQPELLSDTAIQNQLVRVMAEADTPIKYEILWKFIDYGPINDKALLDILNQFGDKKIGIGAYNLILKLVTAEHLARNKEISQRILSLAENENAYIRNLTLNLLNNTKQ